VRRSTLLGLPLGRSGAIARTLLARSLWALVPAAAVLSPAVAFADATTGVIVGNVTDAATKKPLADVVVEVAGATGEQVVVTDSSGSYRIPNLAPGSYSVRVSNEGYKPSGASVTLNANQTIRANINLSPLALQAQEIVVVGKAPTVDVGSSQQGTTITKDFTSRVALSRPGGKGGAARSFESVAEVAPGAHNDDYGVSINGTTSPENQYIVDGLSVNNPAYGIVGTPLSVDFVKEVSVISGGYMPEYGRSTGGVLNVVTKSGGNEFHGSAFLNFSPGALEGERTKVRAAGQTVSTDRKVDLIHDFGAEIGGPILKDKLFFFGGLSYNSTRYRVEQNLNRRVIGNTPVKDADGNVVNDENGMPIMDFARDEAGDPKVEHIPGTVASVRPAVERGIQYIGKLTFAVNPDNQLELGVYGAPADGGGSGAWGVDPQNGGVEGGSSDYSASAHKYVSEANDLSLKWSGAFDNKSFLIDASVGWHHQRAARLPSDGSEIGSNKGLAGVPSILWQKSIPVTHSITDFVAENSGRTGTQQFGTIPAGSCADAVFAADGSVGRDPQCPTTQYFQGGPDFVDDAQLDRYHGKLILTKLFQGLGHHVVKAGLDFEQMSYAHTKAYTGTVRYSENGSGSAFNESRRYGFLSGPDTAVVQSLQKASSNSSSFGAFVQDSWNLLDKVTVNLGVRYDSQYVFGNDGKVALALPLEFAPRVGIVYDITQQGRSKIYANFARYYESIPLDMSDRAFPGESQIGSRRRSYTTGNPNSCDPRTLAGATGLCQNDITNPDGSITSSQVSRARVFGQPYDPNQRWFATGNAKVPVDPNLEPQASDEIVVGGEYEVFPDGRLGLQYVHRYMVNIIEDMSRDEATTYFIGNPGNGIAKDFPKGQRDYDGVSLFFTKNFSDKWLAQVSYTLSFLRGNIGGLFRAETGQLDPNINSDFDLKSLTVNRYGPLSGDSTHEIKVYAARDFPFNEFVNGPSYMQLNLGLGYSGRSGGPTNFLGSHPVYGTSELMVLPRGSGERLPYTHRFDGHVQYDLKLSKSSALSIYMDIFNIFHFQEVTAVDEDYTFNEVSPLVDAKPVKGTDGKLSPKLCSGPDDAATDCLRHPDGTPFDEKTEKNPNYGKPAQYQSPRTFRFGAKITF